MIKIRRQSKVPVGKLRRIKRTPPAGIFWKFIRIQYSITYTQLLFQIGFAFRGKEKSGILFLAHFAFGYFWRTKEDELYRLIHIGLPWIYLKRGKQVQNLFSYEEFYAHGIDFVLQQQYLKERKRRLRLGKSGNNGRSVLAKANEAVRGI